MPAVAPQVLSTEHTLRDSPSHVSLKPAGSGPVPIPVSRKSGGAQPSDAPNSGSKPATAAIEGRPASRSAALSTLPQLATVSSAGHSVAGGQDGFG